MSVDDNCHDEISSLFCAVGSKDTSLSIPEVNQYVIEFLKALGPKDHVMIVPPDFTRYHSQAGEITQTIATHYRNASTSTENNDTATTRVEILPALGTHAPMTDRQIRTMFGDELAESNCILVHDWKTDVETIGWVPSEWVSRATYGSMTDRPWPAQLNRSIWNLRRQQSTSSLASSSSTVVLSVGQVVPHEVMGMANFHKNLFVGTGGADAIHLSHFVGAIHGMERMMGRAHNPLRDILQYAADHFLKPNLNVWYIHTVMGKNDSTNELEIKGLYIGNDTQCYDLACDLSLQVNFTLLENPLKTVVAYMNPDEYHSTWLANKAIYRTRMAIADGGTLIVLAPGVVQFGEDTTIDGLIRTFGYRGTPYLLQALQDHPTSLQSHLSAVAHLIHGSTEGRFRVIYASSLTQAEIEQVGYDYGDLSALLEKYDVQTLSDGWNVDQETGDEFYFISAPALGLWAVSERFSDANPSDTPSPQDFPSVAENLDMYQAGVDGSGGVGGWAPSNLKAKE
jgi:nickel-dependent lactate racemase